jgi:hypothetical protein
LRPIGVTEAVNPLVVVHDPRESLAKKLDLADHLVAALGVHLDRGELVRVSGSTSAGPGWGDA